MSAETTLRKTITCFLCGGVHFYPGPRFGNHLMHEHGIVFHHEFIVLVSQYKDNHSSLPLVMPDAPQLGHDQVTQTNKFIPISCNQCRNPVDQHQFLTSTPDRIRKPDYHNLLSSNQPMNLPSPSSTFTPPKYQLPQYGQNTTNQEYHSGLADASLDMDSNLPARSGFTITCALCHQVYHDESSFWWHITKKHGMVFKQYKEEYGTGQTAIGTGKLQCLICQEEMKHLPGYVDKHLKTHGLNWVKYLDWIKDKMSRRDPKTEGTESKSINTQAISKKIENPEQWGGESRPLNIKDKTNKYCSYCVVTFNTRMTFLQHCQEFHNTKFKNKLGSSLVMNTTTDSVEESRELERKPVVSSTSSTSSLESLTLDSSKYLKSSSPQPDMAVSSSKRKRSEVATPCQFCRKMFSSLSNMERHARQSCTMREDATNVWAADILKS